MRKVTFAGDRREVAVVVNCIDRGNDYPTSRARERSFSRPGSVATDYLIRSYKHLNLILREPCPHRDPPQWRASDLDIVFMEGEADGNVNFARLGQGTGLAAPSDWIRQSSRR